MIKYLWLVLLCNAVVPAKAGNHTIASDKELNNAFHAIKVADGYCYTLTVVPDTGFHAAGAVPVIIPVQKTVYYASKADFIQYVATEGTTYLVSNAGIFRTSGPHKTALYHSFENDSDRNANRALMLAADGSQLLDSVLLREAAIVSRKSRNGSLQYHLTYPDGSMIRSMDVTLNHQKDFLAVVRYVVERRLTPDAGAPTVRQIVVMDHYEHQMPDELSKMLAAIGGNLEAWLRQAYPGYVLKRF